MLLAALFVSIAPEPEEQAPPPQVPFALTAKVEAGVGGIPIHAGGTVRPETEAALAPQVGGKVIWVDSGFKSGARVREGQTLFRIEREDYVHAVEIAKASVAAREVDLLETQESANIAESQYRRYTEHQTENQASKEPNPLVLWQPQLKAARASLAREKANLAQAELALARTSIRAPFDGHVREETVDLGDIVAPNQRTARLIASHAVEVVVSLASRDAALIAGLWDLVQDMPERTNARVIADYGEGRYAWNATVDRAEAALDQQTRTIDVVLVVADPFVKGARIAGDPAPGGSPPLLVGEYVQVEIEGATTEPFFQIPRAALNPDNEIWCVDDAGTISIRTVQVLQRLSDEAYVTGDLAAGMRVVTGGLQFATNGMRVQFSDAGE